MQVAEISGTEPAMDFNALSSFDGSGKSGKATVKEMIRKEGGVYVVRSKDGKKVLGRYKTEKEARKRLKQIEFFKTK